MNTPRPALTADRIHVWRGDRHVLQGVSLAVGPGEALHVRGANGTGKTTLLRVLSGLLRPEQGTVAWAGTSIYADRSAYQAQLAYASHEPALKGDLTALENLRFAVGLKRRTDVAQLREQLERVGALGFADLPARVLSAGQRRRVSMARVVAMRAALWLLDEPFTNLDVRGSALQLELIDEHLSAGGLAVLVAHHDIALATAARPLDLAA